MILLNLLIMVIVYLLNVLHGYIYTIITKNKYLFALKVILTGLIVGLEVFIIKNFYIWELI